MKTQGNLKKKKAEKMGGPGPPGFKCGGAMAPPAPPVPTPLSAVHIWIILGVYLNHFRLICSAVHIWTI